MRAEICTQRTYEIKRSRAGNPRRYGKPSTTKDVVGGPSYLSPRPGKPASAARHRVPARLLRLGFGDGVAALRLGGAVDQAMMDSVTARRRTLHHTTVRHTVML